MYGDIKVFSGRSHPTLAKAIAGHLGFQLGRSKVMKFSNENIMVQIEENVRECDVFVVQTASPPVNEHLIELLIFIDALKSASAARVTAVLPYFFYARSDKKDRPRISITARLVADLLTAAGADRVLTIDLHSPQIQGFFRIPVDQLQAASLLCAGLKRAEVTENAVIVASDAGEAKDIGRYANRLNLPIAIIDKRRYGDDEKAVAENLIGSVEGKTALIVDDEIATGGTMIEAAEFCLKMGAERVAAAATHGILTAPDRFKTSHIEKLLVTDTVPVPEEKHYPGLEVLSVAPLLAEAIRRIHDGRSVSRLFDESAEASFQRWGK
ncbi:MAG: ribose-phosphate pyrophosphokinase [Myxococcales bacterium]|nr:ribose-phosphate pyrophosphokinase [Myxococcales bacterium]